MNYKAGDKVSFLNEKGNGVIINILSNFRVSVLNSDGFEVIYSIQELVPLADKSNYKVDFKSENKWQDQKEEQKIKPPNLEVDEAWEVDLHLHELIDSYQQKSDHEKLLFQLNYFKKCMDAAFSHRIKKAIFIHGVGKGTLRQEIIHALKDYERITHYDAPLKRYGYGAITVEFR